MFRNAFLPIGTAPWTVGIFLYRYLSFVLPIYQFQYIARWKGKDNKNYLSSDIISRDPPWHDMEKCSVTIKGATSLYFVSFPTKYNLLSSWRELQNVRLFRKTSTMKTILNSGGIWRAKYGEGQHGWKFAILTKILRVCSVGVAPLRRTSISRIFGLTYLKDWQFSLNLSKVPFPPRKLPSLHYFLHWDTKN